MKFHLPLLLFCAGLPAFPLLSAQAPKPTHRLNDEEKLEGTWSAVSYAGDVADHLLPSEEALQTMKLFLKRNKAARMEPHRGSALRSTC